MSPKLALSALVGALSLSACYVVPYGSYGYYPAYPTYPGTPVVGTAQTQQEIPVEPAGAPNSGYVQQNYQGADDTPTSAYASATQPTQQYAAGPPIRPTTAATVIPRTVTALRCQSASVGTVAVGAGIIIGTERYR
jgi:hypothetical protein